MPRLLLALAALLALPGCPWDDPCYRLACGEACTFCDASDLECQRAEGPHFCDASGACVGISPYEATSSGFCDPR